MPRLPGPKRPRRVALGVFAMSLLACIQVGTAIFVCIVSARMVIKPMVVVQVCDRYILCMRPGMLHRHQDT